MMARLTAILLISISAACSPRAGVAIVIDPVSEREAAAELSDYENALREADGYTV